MSAPRFYKEKDITQELINTLKVLKDIIDMNFPIFRDATSNATQSLADLFKSQELVLNSMDEALRNIGGLPCNKKVFMDFVKLRDLEKEFILLMKNKLEMDKRFLEILDRFLFMSTQL